MRHRLVLGLASLSLAACGAAPSPVADALPPSGPVLEVEPPPAAVFPQALGVSSWTSGALTASVLPSAQLKPLSAALGGLKIVKSNNPEVFRGNGWLSQHARTDATRGGSAYPLSGFFNYYAFHINKSGSGRYLHLVVTNPQNSAITVSAKGSMYTNAEQPLGGPGTGLNYKVSRNWLEGTHRTTVASSSLASKAGRVLYTISVPSEAMVDGRFEVYASAGAYVYTVVTSSGSATDAINATQGGPAAGDLASTNPADYGRESGVAPRSIYAGTTNIDVPAGPAHLGLCFNTNPHRDPPLQDQTASFAAPDGTRLSDSSPRTWGNYGHKFDVTLALRNPNSNSRTVRLRFASNYTGTAVSFTWNGPALVNGALKNLYTSSSSQYTTLGSWTVAPGATQNVRVTLFVPGLITTNQQFQLEAL